MKRSKIGSVMTSEVVRVGYDTPFKEVARLLHEHRISGLPVVDVDEKVIGVISETDLLARQTTEPDLTEHRVRWPHFTAGSRAVRARKRARTAGRLMSRPAVTTRAEDTIAEAARTMAHHRVERLPVVDEKDRLVGIVTRRDLLQVFLRPDEDLRRDVIEEVLVRTLWLGPGAISVEVQEGVITLRGQLERRSAVSVAVRMAQQIDGVVAVVDKLTYRFDDSHLRPDEQALHGVADEWLRKL
ncbi:CBS domain-containing protein [Actinomycetota bacterium Odt1-20B]